jgi:hypothetical protein
LDKPGLLEYLLRIDKIRVSLNAVDKGSYRGIMGVDKFDVVKDNLADLIKRKRDANSIGISFVVFKENYRQILGAINLAQQLGVGFLDLRVVHVTDICGFDRKQRGELRAILEQVKRKILLGTYGRLRISIADTFNFLDPDNYLLRNLKRDFVDELVNFRVTVAPHGKMYALNVIAQPTREDPRYLLGDFNEDNSLLSILRNKKSIPFEPSLFLPHDISLIVALPKLKSDCEFGIGLNESPFNFKHGL